MSKDQDWSVEDDQEAIASFEASAQIEFERLKLDLKRKAGLLPVSLWRRVWNSSWGSLKRLVGF